MYQASNAAESAITHHTSYNINNNNISTTINNTINSTQYEQKNDVINNYQQQLGFHVSLEPSPLAVTNSNNNNNQVYESFNDAVSFTFDEIGAIINSKDFEDISAAQKVTQDPQKDEQQQQQYQQQYHNSSPDYQYIKSVLKSEQQVNENNRQGSNYNAYVESCHLNNFDHQAYLNNNNQQQKQQEDTKEAFYDNTIMATNQNNNGNHKTNCGLFANLAATTNALATNRPYIEIVEQPAKCALRFRYKCEGRSAGSLPGVSSTADNKTFPSIRIMDYVGRAVVVISCVTKDAPYRAHPHNIVGKEGCKKGICTIVINNNEPNTIRSFSSIGIQCVKRKDIEESLSLRESIHVDPFRNGFQHKLCASNIDLNVVRLCFQVFIEGSTPNKCDIPLTPVVSDPIHDKKAMSDLVITKLSHCSAPATGGREVILLCDRISKDDIQIRFYEERDGKVIWETFSELSPADVHKQVAICFKTPKYYNENITQPVMVKIQLRRNSDNQVSEPRLFQFLPCESDEDIISRKRQKIEWINNYAINNILHHHQHEPHVVHHLQINHQLERSNNQQQQQQTNASNHQPQVASPSPNNQAPHQGTSPVPPKQHLAPDQSSQSPRLSPSPTRQQQQGRFMIDNTNQSNNLVVRREIIDNDGKVMRLVDRPNLPQANNQQQSHLQHHQQQQLDTNGGNQVANRPLGSSLDRIDTAELMRDMNFNSNMDLNLGSSLSIHLNGGDMQHLAQAPER